jgi:hypothetical protein
MPGSMLRNMVLIGLHAEYRSEMKKVRFFAGAAIMFCWLLQKALKK